MFEIIKAGGWVMWPLMACSVVALAIAGERWWTLRPSRVVPKSLVSDVRLWHRQRLLDPVRIEFLRQHSPLGVLYAAGLSNHRHGREVMKECLEDAGRKVLHGLERHLNMLGSIALVTPLLGLLGTVFGIMHVFASVSRGGAGNPETLASGIAEALITTAFGLTIAIPSLLAHRYLTGRVDELVVEMEDEALRLVELVHGERDTTVGDAP